MLKATKVRIYPTAEQADFLNQQFGAVRFVWNKALGLKNHFYKVKHQNLSPLKDLKPLLDRGLSQGASLDNVLVVGDTDYMTPPRIDDEAVRHKILDVIGDFSILDRPLQGHLVCVASGHSLNRKLVMRLHSELSL